MSLQALNRWAFDVGTARIGSARSPRGSSVCVPAGTFQVERFGQHFDDIEDALVQMPPDVIYVGLPLHLNGSQGQSVAMAKKFAKELRQIVPGVKFRMVDERLTTSTAHQRLAQAQVGGCSRKPIVDQAAAIVILESALDYESQHDDLAGTAF